MSYSSLAGGQCRSPACKWASNRLSGSGDPFSHPCDYFLSTCVLIKGGRQRDQNATTHAGDHREKVTKSLGQQTHKSLGEETIPDRKSMLLLHLRNILGNQTELRLKVQQTPVELNCACLNCLVESNDSPRRTSLLKAQKFYRSCLDTEAIEKAGEAPFLQLVQKVRWSNELMDGLSRSAMYNMHVATEALN